MINPFEIIETIKMIDEENLDIRTITMGISLKSCAGPDIDEVCRKIYDKITTYAKDLVKTGEDIEKQFGLRVRQLVAKESEDKKESMPKSQSWQIRKQEAIDKLKQEDDLGVKIVCLCDKVSNLRSFQLLCFDKGDDAWNSFNMKDPKEHYWYYSSILEALSELKDTPVYKEYDFLVHSIFD